MNPSVVLPALTSILALVFALALFDQWRERRGGFQLIWTLGMVFYGVGAGCEAIGAGERLERGAVPDLVPDRRGLDGRLARARDGVPARPDAVRLQLRAVPVPGRAVHVPAPHQARVRRGRRAAAALLHRRRRAGPRGRGRDLLRQRPLADAGRGGRRRGDDPEPRPDGDDDAAGARLRGRPGDRRPGRDALPGPAPAADAVPEHHRRVRADPRRDLLDLRVHAQAAGARLLARSEPAGRRVPVQPGHRAGRDHGQPRRVAARVRPGRWSRASSTAGSRRRSSSPSGRSWRRSATRSTGSG